MLVEKKETTNRIEKKMDNNKSNNEASTAFHIIAEVHFQWYIHSIH